MLTEITPEVVRDLVMGTSAGYYARVSMSHLKDYGLHWNPPLERFGEGDVILCLWEKTISKDGVLLSRHRWEIGIVTGKRLVPDSVLKESWEYQYMFLLGNSKITPGSLRQKTESQACIFKLVGE